MEFDIDIKAKFILVKPTAYESQVDHTKALIETTKKRVKDCAYDVWLAHEWIVTKQGEWAKISWKQYCKDIGIDRKTPLNWFQKAGIEYTKTRQKPTEEPSSVIEKPMVRETEPEVKERLEEVISDIKESKEIFQDDLKELVDTIADSLEGPKASAVLGHASRVYKESGQRYGPPKVNTDSEVRKMTNAFHKFLNLLEKVKNAGHKNLSEKDKNTMDHEFKLMVPRALRLFDWMGIDLQPLVTQYVNRYKEVDHVQPNTERLVGDR